MSDGHTPSVRMLVAIFATLMLLTGLTVWVATIHLGSAYNDIVALTVATCKAILVIVFFMEVRFSPRLTWLVIVAGFVWLAVLIVFTLSDYRSRGWLRDVTVPSAVSAPR